MITYGCSLSRSNERKRFQEKIALVWRVDEDPFGGYPVAYIPHTPSYTENVDRVSCAVCLELVQVQTLTITSQEKNVSLLWMPGVHVALASAV